MWLVGAVFGSFAPPSEESTGGFPYSLPCNTPCPCLLVSLLFCLTVWGHRSTFVERNVCFWEMVAPHPVFVLVESEKLFCDAIVLFVSV